VNGEKTEPFFLFSFLSHEFTYFIAFFLVKKLFFGAI